MVLYPIRHTTPGPVGFRAQALLPPRSMTTMMMMTMMKVKKNMKKMKINMMMEIMMTKMMMRMMMIGDGMSWWVACISIR